MPITASSGQQQALPVQAGSRTLQLPNPALQNGGNITGVATINSDKFTIQLVPSGTLAADASFALKAQINGSTYLPLCWPNTKTPIVFTGAEVNAGVIASIDAKVLAIQGVLTPGSTAAGANGVSMRVID